MKNSILLLTVLICCSISLHAQTTTVEDDFEGNGTITTWLGDECDIDTSYANPFQEGINTSNTVLEYQDTGGQYANVRFQVQNNFDLSEEHTFTLMIYVPTSGITGNQTNQVSLKLQDGNLGAPWATQCEIIKPLSLDQWQAVTFDFENDEYINLDPNSPPPTERTDFNRVVIQINGEDNTDHVLAYIDNFYYDGTLPTDPVYDNLVWSDEFDENGAVDPDKWFHQTQLPLEGSWYNGEIQHYTDRIQNSHVENGILSITAIKETFTDQGYTKDFTSARLNSKFAFTYGKVEVRAKLPSGAGTWPAIWTLGQNIEEPGAYWDIEGYGTAPWPYCGEIDIMEHWGTNQNYVQSATHTPSSFGGTVNLGGQVIPTASTEFHTYVLEWTPEKLIFSVDGVEHYTYDPPVKDENTWPFDKDQYLLLNVAILPGTSPSFTSSSMDVDYVRVYQSSPVSTNELKENQNISAYPVPFTNELTIRLDHFAEQNATVSIYSMNGRLVKTFTYPVHGTNVVLNNLENLPKGIYLFRISEGRTYQSIKVIKN